MWAPLAWFLVCLRCYSCERRIYRAQRWLGGRYVERDDGRRYFNRESERDSAHRGPRHRGRSSTQRRLSA